MTSTPPPDSRPDIPKLEPLPDDNEPVTRLDLRASMAVLLSRQNEIVRRQSNHAATLERLTLGVMALNVIAQLSPEDRSEKLTAALERIADAVEGGRDELRETQTNGFDDLARAMRFPQLSAAEQAAHLERVGLKPNDLN